MRPRRRGKVVNPTHRILNAGRSRIFSRDFVFSYSIVLPCRRSCNVRFGLDEASCPGRRSYPGFDVFLSSSSVTYRALRCLTHTCYFVYSRRPPARTCRKLNRQPGTVATRSRSGSRGPIFSLKVGPVHKLFGPDVVACYSLRLSRPDLHDLVNDHTRQRLAHRASCAQGVHGGRAFLSLADAPATPPSLSTSASADDRRRVSEWRVQNGSNP